MIDASARTGVRASASQDKGHLVGDLLRRPRAEYKVTDLLSRGDVIALMQLVHTGTSAEASTARDVLVEWNQGLVHSNARRYLGRGLEFDDLVQEGNLGLLKAIERFDETRGWSFSTYATWWIRQAISRSVMDKGRAIRIPVHRYAPIQRYQKVYAQLASDNGVLPTREELAEALQMTVEEVQILQQESLPILSLNYTQEGDEDGEGTLEHYLTSPEMQVDEDVGQEDMIVRVRALVADALTDREARIVLQRYRGTSLEALASEFKVTRERVRQIQERAEEKLRKHPAARQLMDALG